MREIDVKMISDNVAEMCIEANYYLSEDMKSCLNNAVESETGELGKKVLNSLKENLDIAANDMIPICQDTGMAVVFIKVGQDVHLTGGNIEEAINNGVHKGYVDGYLRKSVVKDPIYRENTKDNTPAIIHYSIVQGDKVEITLAPKGFGSENMSKVYMLKPADGIEGVKNAILSAVKDAGPNACPPMVIGVGIGGDFEKAAIMSKQALALKYRPKKFKDLVEQDAIKSTLLHQLETNTIKNCYLFTGGAGTGKTTSARIFANEINNGIGNIIEMDAASNNSVDDIRKIIEDAKFRSITGKYKVYLLDEVHMITTAGWNAFLKMIEEPPANTIFIMCTTDPQKIPNTILSRVQRYDFRKISFMGIVERLKYIINQENEEGENISYEEDAIKYIAKLADGGMRDSITTLDKCISYNKNLTLDNITKALGTVNYDTMFDLTTNVYNYETNNVIQIIEDIYMSGVNIKQFVKDYSLFVLDLCKYGLTRTFNYIQIPDVYKNSLDVYDNNAYAFFNQLLGEMIKLNTSIKWETSPKPVIESTFILLCQKG